MKLPKLIFFLGLALLCFACASDESTSLKTANLDLPEQPYLYDVGTNDHIPTLGRVLFYDKQLSINNSVSCASCHKQNAAFADNVAFSRGFDNRLTSRNSMPIQNLAGSIFGFMEGDTVPSPLSSSFVGRGSTPLFWDGRERELKSMVLKPIGNHVEMGIRDMHDLNTKLAAVPYYKDLFTKAYGSEEVTSEKIAEALSSFLISITSDGTRFDKSLREQKPLTALELTGQQLFSTTYNCNECHQVQNPHGYIMAGTFSNIGLDIQYQDKGLQAVTQRQEDNGKFKIPSLRNVALTAPYMHDGRFKTLDEVLDHYSKGIENNSNLDTRLKENGRPKVFDIPEHEKTAIIAFLNTLTDDQMISDPKYSNPFKAR